MKELENIDSTNIKMKHYILGVVIFFSLTILMHLFIYWACWLIDFKQLDIVSMIIPDLITGIIGTFVYASLVHLESED